MAQVTEDRIERLPKWAQAHIASLERQLSCSQERLDQLCQQGQGSRVRSVDLLAPSSPIHLPDDDIVEFTLGDGHVLSVTLDGQRLNVRASGTRSAWLSLRPHSGNLLSIGLETDR